MLQVFDEDTQQLTTLLAFYASSIVGTLEHCSEISEKHVTAIIPSLIDGLQSSILDYVSASYIIIARLITALSLRQDLLEEFIILISKVSTQQGKQMRYSQDFFLWKGKELWVGSMTMHDSLGLQTTL